jgi:tetratricopeptide (TPR) repeat protein
MRIAQTLEQLVPILVSTGRTDEADQAFSETIEIYRTLFPGDSATVAFHNAAYGHWLRQHGRFEKAEPYFREAIRTYRQMDNPPREYYLLSLDGLFQLIRRRDDALEETIAIFHECMLNMGRMFGADHPTLAPHMLGFAYLLGEAQRWSDAVPLLVEGLRINRKARGAEWDAKQTLATLARHVQKIVITPGLPVKNYETALDGATALLAEKAENADYLALRGMALVRLGRCDEALADLDQGASPDEDSALTLERLAFLALARNRTGAIGPARQAFDALQARISRRDAPIPSELRPLLADVDSSINGDARELRAE